MAYIFTIQKCVFRVYCECCRASLYKHVQYRPILFGPYVSEATVIRGWHCSVPLGPVHPVIFPSSARALNGEGGSVTSLPRTTTGEGGALITHHLLRVAELSGPLRPRQPPAELQL